MAQQLFLSTLSLRRATLRPLYLAHVQQHFYPRSPCGERQGGRLKLYPPGIFLSTLSLRRATILAMAHLMVRLFLSTLSLRRATADDYSSNAYNYQTFLSTLSLRRATGSNQSIISQANNFYPRSPCGERLYDTYAKVLRVNISIHALLAESDFQTGKLCNRLQIFLSTLSLRRATIR